MNLTIVGATGGTGKELLRQALDRGHRVTAAARRPEALREWGERVRVARIDLSDAASVRAAVAGADAVVSALGPGGMREAMRPTSVLADGARALIAAMRAERTRRLIMISSGGVDHDPAAPWYYRALLRRLLMNSYMDMIEDGDLAGGGQRGPRLDPGATHLSARRRESPI